MEPLDSGVNLDDPIVFPVAIAKHSSGEYTAVGTGECSASKEIQQMKTTRLVLEIPRDVLDAVKLPPAEMERELRRELALALYERGALPLGKAHILAEMTRWDFEDLLGARRVARHYSAADLQEDIEYGHGH